MFTVLQTTTCACVYINWYQCVFICKVAYVCVCAHAFVSVNERTLAGGAEKERDKKRQKYVFLFVLGICCMAGVFSRAPDDSTVYTFYRQNTGQCHVPQFIVRAVIYWLLQLVQSLLGHHPTIKRTSVGFLQRNRSVAIVNSKGYWSHENKQTTTAS